MDVLSWSRHHRLFPGEGAFDLGAFVAHVLRAGYDGPLSLEVFNDIFRQTDGPGQRARRGARSPGWRTSSPRSRTRHGDLRRTPTRLPPVAEPSAFDFVEVRADDTGDVDVLLGQLGFTFRGRHRSKDARLWTEGSARGLQRAARARREPDPGGWGFEVADPAASAARAQALQAPAVYRRTLAHEQELPAFRAPDGTEVFLGPVAGRRTPPGSPSSRVARSARGPC